MRPLGLARPHAAEWLAATLALLTLAGRVALAAAVGVAPDEAYYLSWSRHLAAGYLDHPPAVAWLIAGATALAGEGPLGLRLPALVLGGAVLPALLYWLGREAGLTGRLCWLLPLSTVVQPLGLAGGLLITPDVPLLVCWTGCAAAALRALRRGSTGAWLLAGLALGCALLSKHSAWLLLGAVGLGLLLAPRGQRPLRRPGPWLGLTAALIVASPNLWWDLSRGLPSLGFQLHHGLTPSSLLGAPGRLAELIGGQLGLLTPLVAWGVLWALRRGWPAEADRRLLLLLSLAPLAAFAAASLLAHPEANWPAPTHPPLLTLTLLRLSDELRRSSPERARRLRRFALAAVLTSASLSALVVVHVLAPLPLFPPDREPVARLRGWRDLPGWLEGRRPGALRAEGYELAAALSYHLPGRPPITVGCPELGGCPPDALALVAAPGSAQAPAPAWLRSPGRCPRLIGAYSMRRGDGATVRTLRAYTLGACPEPTAGLD